MSNEETPLLANRDDLENNNSISGRIQSLQAGGKANSLEKCLAILAVILLVISTILVGLFTGEKSKLDSRIPPSETTIIRTTSITAPTSTVTFVPTPTKTPRPVCLTADCVSTAARILANLDERVDPCDDFYLFSNGGWIKENPIPSDKAIIGVGEQVDKRNKRIIQSIITSKPSTTLGSADLANLKTLNTFYESCLNVEEIDRVGIKPIISVVQELVELWRGEDKLDGRWDPETRKTRLTDTLAFLHSKGVASLFSFYVEGDVKGNPSDMVLWLQQDGLTLPSRDYYSDNSVLELLEETVVESLGYVYESLGSRTDHMKSVSRSVVEFEKQIANATLTAVESDDPELTYNPYNSTSFFSLLPSISIPDYFSAMFPRPSFPNPVIVTGPSYITKLVEILSETEEETLEAYFIFQLLNSFTPLISTKEPLFKSITNLQNSYTGIDVIPPRDEICLESLTQEFGFMVGRFFVQEAFSGDSKIYAESIIKNTIAAFADRLPSIEFLDKKSKKAAGEKVAAIDVKIGYPSTPNTTDPLSLARYYSIQTPTKNYFENVLNSKIATQKRMWVKVGRQRDRGEWEMFPSTVNAYYNPPANEIVFPSGILQPPYFSSSWPEYLSYGSFGSVAGHEISHSVDKAGRQYTKEGKLEDWWSKATVAKFEKLTECFIKQYSKYFIIGPDGERHYINAQLTLGEDGADSGGLAQAFDAWKKRLDNKTDTYGNFNLPALNYTREQLFFIAFGQGWAREATPLENVRRIRIDPHSPTSFRVIGTLSNSVEFNKAFNCPVGSRMNRAEKCKIW